MSMTIQQALRLLEQDLKRLCRHPLSEEEIELIQIKVPTEIRRAIRVLDSHDVTANPVTDEVGYR